MCVPGMICFQNTTSIQNGCIPIIGQFPCNCQPPIINSTNVLYSGNTLSNINVNNGDNLTTVLAKIDSIIGTLV